mgnify:FL=1
MFRSQDHRIRSWLRNNGYEVIEIAVSDLADEGAMTRHFRRLAGFLDAGDIRDALRKDASWFRCGRKADSERGRFALRLIRPLPKDRFVNCVPLMPLKVAAGNFSEPQNIGDEEWDLDWVEIDTHRHLRKGMFVAQVVGKSMEPAIPDGAYCLFGSPVEGTRQGRTVVVLLRDTADPETGQRFTVKRYESEKAVSEDGTWRHVRVLLKPINRDFQPIELTCEDEGSVEVVAEMLEILG